MEIINFITSNPGKIREARAILNIPIAQVKMDLPEIQQVEVEEVVRWKLLEAYKLLAKPVLVEDTSLTFVAWNQLPGALIKWFLQSVGVGGLCRMLDRSENREAIAKTAFGYCDGAKIIIATGEIKGTIAKYPKGEQGFGWDPIFIPRGYKLTFAEMLPEQKNEISMRRLALENLSLLLKY